MSIFIIRINFAVRYTPLDENGSAFTTTKGLKIQNIKGLENP